MPVTTEIIPYAPENTPMGFDRAEGGKDAKGTTCKGTAPIDGAISVQSPLGEQITFEELPDSPTIERGEQCTCTHKFRGSVSDIVNRLGFLGRGTMFYDSYDLIWKVLSSDYSHHGTHAILNVVSESLSFDTPWDEFSCTPCELGMNILKHPRYFSALDGSNETERLQNQAVIRRLQDYFDNVSAPYRDSLIKELNASMSGNGISAAASQQLAKVWDGTYYTGDGKTPGTVMAKAAAKEIIQKYWRNEETPYLIGVDLQWSRYYWRPQNFNPGGKSEDPFTECNPQIPEYFWKTEAGANFLAWMAKYNPQCYSDSGLETGTTRLSWLRMADQVDHQRTWFKITRKWKGGANGIWDPELYAAKRRPQNQGDFVDCAVPNVAAAPP